MLSATERTRLHQQIVAAGIPIDGIGNDGVNDRIDFKAEATAEQRRQAATMLVGYDPTRTETERLDALAFPPRVLAALTLRLSTAWPNDIPLEQRQRIQAIIDAAAVDVRGVLSP